MALPLSVFKITEVRKPAVGEFKPAAVTADIVIDTRSLRGNVRAEWDELKLHDVLFLLTISCARVRVAHDLDCWSCMTCCSC